MITISIGDRLVRTLPIYGISFQRAAFPHPISIIQDRLLARRVRQFVQQDATDHGHCEWRPTAGSRRRDWQLVFHIRADVDLVIVPPTIVGGLRVHGHGGTLAQAAHLILAGDLDGVALLIDAGHDGFHAPGDPSFVTVAVEEVGKRIAHVGGHALRGGEAGFGKVSGDLKGGSEDDTLKTLARFVEKDACLGRGLAQFESGSWWG